MNKKLMTLAVAGAFAAPAAAFAQASNVQIFGTMYMEYSYAKQGLKSPAGTGDLVDVDVLQSPGSEIGVKGEEALGNGMSVWFQCASTADIRGSTGAGAGQGIFCGRNSAIGMKSSIGNVYVGNWDMPIKKTKGTAMMLSDTGIWGVGRMLYGDSSSYTANGTAANSSSFSRRQNASLHYDSPNFSGFQAFAAMSSTTTSTAQTTVVSGSKPRVWGLAGTYTNGPLYLTLGYENHKNFSPNATAVGAYNGEDHAWQAGGAYTFGPVKVGLLYIRRNFDMSANGGTTTDLNAWNVAGQWHIAGPHSLRGGFTKANDTSGSGVAAAPVGGAGGAFVANAGAGGTGGRIWQAQYVYAASKRTELTAGVVYLKNDTNARYSLGGLAAGAEAAGQNQHAFAVSIKNRF